MKLPACLFTLCLMFSSGSLADSLRVVSEAWAPYVFKRDGRYVGVDLEVTERVLRALGHEVVWDLLPWKRAVRTVERGHAQAILDIVPTPQRTETLIFTDEPLSTTDTVLFYHRDRPHSFESLSDLNGLVIGVSPGYTYSSTAFIESTGFRREPAPSFEANLLKLIRGRLDMVAMDRRVGLYLAQELRIADQLRYSETPLSSGRLYLAFHRSEAMAEIADAFGPALREFKQTEEYAAILKRYGQAVGAGEIAAALP